MMGRLTEGSSRPSAAMTTAESRSRGITTELQVLQAQPRVIGAAGLDESSLLLLIINHPWFFLGLLSPPPKGLARPPNRR